MRPSSYYFLGYLLIPAVGLADDSCIVAKSDIYTPKLPQVVSGEISVTSDNTELLENNFAKFSGNIEMRQDELVVYSQHAEIDRAKRSVKAELDIRMQTPAIEVLADTFVASMDQRKMVLQNSRYQLAQGGGKGTAEELKIDEQGGFLLSDATFSTCLTEDPDWKIKAESIEVSPDNLWGETWNTRFYLFDVPVLYLPYFGFPLSTQRQTGLLYPKISSSSNYGGEFETPFYWNIADNYDATISPRLMTNRGLQLKTEFRYLTEQHAGQLDLELLPNDDAWSGGESRHYQRWQHVSRFSNNWRMSLDAAHISDDNYIVDLGSDHHQSTDTYLSKSLNVSYFGNDVNANIAFEDFQVLGENQQGYKALPHVTVNYRKALGLWGAHYYVDSQLSHFQNIKDSSDNALRVHVEPGVYWPYVTPSGRIEVEAKVFHTQYYQDEIAGSSIRDEVSRTIPQLRIGGKLNFERKTHWFAKDSVQTLEPRVQYLYTDYEDQSDIGLYDTSLLLDDFHGLFRERRFSGVDRIADANQLSIGVTSRVLDKNNREQMQLSVGQIIYLDDSRTNLGDATSQIDKGRSALAADMRVKLSSKWQLSADIQFDTDKKQTRASSMSLDYRVSDKRFVQLNHRVSRDISNQDIEQVGVVTSWSMSKRWQVVASLYKDIENRRTIESYLGVQYESCCWAVQLAYRKHINSNFDGIDSLNRDEFDSGISLNFEIRGASRSSGIGKMLKDSIFAYRKPYFLNK